MKIPNKYKQKKYWEKIMEMFIKNGNRKIDPIMISRKLPSDKIIKDKNHKVNYPYRIKNPKINHNRNIFSKCSKIYKR